MRADELDSPYGRHVWDTYHLIGDVLRNNDLGIKPSERFYARMSKAIDDEPSIVAPQAHRNAPMRLGLSGLAVAAAVASVRSDEHPSELQSLMRRSYAVFCLNKTTHT